MSCYLKIQFYHSLIHMLLIFSNTQITCVLTIPVTSPATTCITSEFDLYDISIQARGIFQFCSFLIVFKRCQNQCCGSWFYSYFSFLCFSILFCCNQLPFHLACPSIYHLYNSLCIIENNSIMRCKLYIHSFFLSFVIIFSLVFIIFSKVFFKEYSPRFCL